MTPNKLASALMAYRTCHRDRRNVLTHAVGIPLIVLAVEIVFARPALMIEGYFVTPALVATALAIIFYMRLDARFGLVMAGLLLVFNFAGYAIAELPHRLGLPIGLVLFTVGWVFQLVGHKFEGRRPAFIDDIRSLLVGPLFLVAEAAFALGLRGDLRHAVEGGEH